MPEYSSTTITPSDGVQVPSMNGSTSGNFLLSALKSYILAEKGLANGLASLDANGKLPSSQLPDLADDVIVVDSYATLPATGTAGKIYITADNNKMYRWDSDLETPNYVDLSIDLTEYARIEDIQDGNIQAGVAVKAFQDAMGRAIITTYETKADASDLKDAIEGNTARIENLEQEHGGYYDVDVKSVYTVPSGKAKNWAVNVLRGVTRVRNQLVNGLYARPETYGLTREATADGGIRIYGTCTLSTSFTVATMPSVTSGHSYLTSLGATLPAGCRISTSSDDKASSAVSTLSTATFGIDVTSGLTIDITLYPIVRDLTLYFNGSIPSDADTIAEIQQNYPWLLEPSDYDTGTMVDTTYEGVESTGINLWDSSINNAGSIPLPDNKCVTLKSGKTYYLKIGVASGSEWRICYTLRDLSGNLITDSFESYINENRGVTLNGNKTWWWSGNRTITEATLQVLKPCRIGLGLYIAELESFSLATNVIPANTPYMHSTLTLPSPVTLKSAGTVHEEYDLETGKKSNPLGSYTFTGNESGYSVSSVGRVYLAISEIISYIKPPSSRSIKANILSAGWITIDDDHLESNSMQISVTTWGQIGFCLTKTTEAGSVDALKAYLQSNETTIYFELATPDDPTQLTPVENPYLATEAGGTISSILTTPVDDNMNLGYLNL